MHHINFTQVHRGALLALTLTLPGVALAYDNRDAIRDCESRMRSEYGLMDLRESRAVQVSGGRKHYRVEGKTKIDGDKYPWYCEIDDRRVVDIRYRGPKPDRGPTGGGRPDNAPQIVPRHGGGVEIRLGSGCRAVFDREGELIDRNQDCSRHDLRRADDAADDYLTQRRHDRNRRPSRDEDRGYDEDRSQGLPKISGGRNGEGGRATFDNGCVVYYDRAGRTQDARPECRDKQVMQADRAMREYRREEGL